ncbi:MAG: type IV pilin protein [Candidatus Avelusimicrobium sp.]|uniref:type IV pilin protein n=1 Tax=Candidatus Avelusimicrobium sp. TaxID=3048833 RepID=UPI003EFF6740
MKNGFTLIELLVVVLIIGILSAVALPQYNRAVLKARYSEIQTIISAYKTAAEAYYMANGAYPDYWHDMDLEPPSGCTANDTTTGNYMACKNSTLSIDLYNANQKNLVGFYRPNGKIKVAYIQWLDVSAKPGKRECWALAGDAEAQAFCKSLNGTESGTSTHANCISNGGCTVYELP